jgi:class 3 adenylate cyclase
VFSDHHTSDACCAALECRNRIQELNEDWQAQGKKPFWLRIGIQTVKTLVDNVGSANRMNYPVVGDSVNLVSSSKGINKAYQNNIIVSSETWESGIKIPISTCGYFASEGEESGDLGVGGLKGTGFRETEAVLGRFLERCLGLQCATLR